MNPNIPENANQKFNDPRGADKTFQGFDFKTLKNVSNEGKSKHMDIPDDMISDGDFNLSEWVEPEKTNNGKKPTKQDEELNGAYAGSLVGTSTEVSLLEQQSFRTGGDPTGR